MTPSHYHNHAFYKAQRKNQHENSPSSTVLMAVENNSRCMTALGKQLNIAHNNQRAKTRLVKKEENIDPLLNLSILSSDHQIFQSPIQEQIALEESPPQERTPFSSRPQSTFQKERIAKTSQGIEFSFYIILLLRKSENNS